MADKNQPLKINNRKRAVDGESWLEKGFSTGSLRSLAIQFVELNSTVSDRISGFAQKLESEGPPPVTQCIFGFLQDNNVSTSDLWTVNGNKGLVGIRNKLAHRGANQLHHQSLAVATFHLSLLNERLVHCMLGLSYSNDEFHSGREPWLQHSYVNSLKKCLFNPNS